MTETTPGSRRDRRDEARRRRRRWFIGGGVVIAVLALGGAGAVAAGVLRDDGDDAGAGAPGSSTSTTRATAVDTTVPTCRPLSVEDPLRLWIGGDSLAGSLGPSLGEMTADTGVIAPTYYSKVSSGLTSVDFFDWPEEAAEELVEVDPEVVVFIIDTNDTMIVDDDDDEWRAEYDALVEEMLAVFLGAGDRHVYWIGGPIIEDDRSEDIQALNAVAQEVAARYPDDVTYIDAYALFSDENGEYADSLPDETTGEDVRVRAGDGIHLTPEGGDRLARAVFDLLDVQCSVTAQADPTRPQDVVQTEGSDSIPGTYRPPDATTATTAPPSTAAPSTTAPSTTMPSTTAPTATTSSTTPPCTGVDCLLDP